MTSHRGSPATSVADTGEDPAIRLTDTEPPPAQLGIRHRTTDGTVVVEVSGEVDLDTSPQLRAAIVHCVDQAGNGSCVLDLTTVSFLDSAGLTALLHGSLRARERHGSLRIVVDSNSPVIRPIAVTGLDLQLALYHTVDEAKHATSR